MLFLCTLPGASRTMDNTEVIISPLDNIPNQYFSSYFSLLHEVCDDQYDHTHQLEETFFFTEKYEIYYIIYENLRSDLMSYKI